VQGADGEDLVNHDFKTNKSPAVRAVRQDMILGMKNAQAGGLRILKIRRNYFFGVVWLVGCVVPDRTEWSPLERASKMVRPMEVSMKRMAE